MSKSFKKKYILKAPWVTEKTTALGSENKYVFEVEKGANKTEIKKSVANLYGVKVEKVATIKIPGKKKRFGRSEGVKSGYKKAIVSLAKGEIIKEL